MAQAIKLYVEEEYRPPLKIDCEGLSQKHIADLADRLSLHFEAVRPLDSHHYNAAWRIIAIGSCQSLGSGRLT